MADRNNLPPTYTVRSGRRVDADGNAEYGVQMYYRKPFSTQGRKTWMLDGCSGDFKSIGGLVVAPPSIHPDSGAAYEVLLDLPIVERPEFILSLPVVPTKAKSADGASPDDGLIDTTNRNDDMCSYIGTARNKLALTEMECLALCLRRNDRYTKGPRSRKSRIGANAI